MGLEYNLKMNNYLIKKNKITEEYKNEFSEI